MKSSLTLFLAGMLFVVSLSSCEEDTRPLFTEVYTEKSDMPIEIALKYNLSDFVNQYQKYYGSYPTDDISDLIAFHGMVSNGDATIGVAELLRKEDSETTFREGYEPEVFFRFSSPTTQKSRDISYIKYDESLCEDRLIKDAPKMTTTNNRLIVTFSAHTIKTRGGVMVKWVDEKHLVYSENKAAKVRIEQSGEVSHQYSFITKGSVGGQVGGRSGQTQDHIIDRPDLQPYNPNDDSHFYSEDMGETPLSSYELVPNLIASDLEAGEYVLTRSPMDCLIPSVLTQGICKGGKQVEGITWEAPVLLSIEKVSR